MKRKPTRTPHEPVLSKPVTEALLHATKSAYPSQARSAALRARILMQVRDAKNKPSEQLVTIRSDQAGWIKLSALVDLKILHREKDSHYGSFLLRMQAGGALPAHDHMADEECVVLEGEVSMGELHVKAGDYHFAPKGIPHDVITSKTGALLFLRGGLPASAQAAR